MRQDWSDRVVYERTSEPGVYDSLVGTAQVSVELSMLSIYERWARSRLIRQPSDV